MYLIFPSNFVSNVFNYRKKWTSCDHKCIFWSSCEIPLFLSDFNESWIFSTNFGNTQISSGTIMRPKGTEFFHGDGQTDKHIWRSFQSIFDILRTRLKTILCPLNGGILFWINRKIKSIFHKSELYNTSYFTVSKDGGLPYRCVEALQTHTYV
jgi:hypothetical protein